MDRTRTGFVTQLGMDHVEAIERGGEIGFDHVELMMDGAGERRRLANDREPVKEALGTAGLDLLVHLPFALDVGSPYEHVRAGAVREIEAAIGTAADLGAEKGVLHVTTGAWEPAWDDDELRPLVLDSVRTLDAFGAERGVEVCVENTPSGFFRTREFGRLFAETDVSMTFDTGHARMHGLDSEEMGAFVADHRDRISHFHLNDTRVPKDEHLPFGAGTLDFGAILGPLDGWDGTLSLEVFTLDFDYIARSKERLDALR